MKPKINLLIAEFEAKLKEKYEHLKKSRPKAAEKEKLMNELWELTKEKFVLETKNINDFKSYEGMIFTVGFTSKPLVLNILATNPKAIFFIYTQESEQTVNEVVDKLNLKSSQFKREIIKKDSFELAVDLVGMGLSYLHKEKGIDLNNIGLDITGGTKIMSVACGLGTFSFGPDGPDLFYVTHDEYDAELRIPVPGTERLIIVKNPMKEWCDALSEQGFDDDIQNTFK
ncbi:MAG: hypothetical protein BAJALOKI1v1_150016 [Promethearchaeota archaeon]|nr:MAG: hypothetical protein BAJALOKI1v1_150016 [Candidatus Lokiarchaeota archaeon]